MSAAPKIGQLLSYELEVLKGPHAGQKFVFDKPSITIGRGSENQVCLSQDLRVSRVHAEIKNSSGQLFFVNISQKNYVLVDGEKSEFYQLERDCTLTIGESEIRFRSSALKSLPMLTPAKPMDRPTPNLAIAKPFPTSVAQPSFPSAMSGGPSAQNKFSAPRPVPANSNSRMKFYLIIAAVGLAVYFLFFNTSKKNSKNAPIRGSDIIEKDLQNSQNQIDVLESRLAKQNTLTNKRAEENFIKGFRDYQKGQYLRAKEYFRIVLNLNPEHMEARKYYEQSTIKHRKRMEFNFIEGLKNKERKNYRLCKSFFTQVLVLAQGDRTSYEKYDEAEKYLRECNLGLEGRF